MNRTRIILITLVVAVLMGGAAYAGYTMMTRGYNPADLGLDLQVNPGELTVISLRLTNTGSGPMTLRFNSAQQYDFIVYKQQGSAWTKVWQWSDDMMFAEAETSLDIPAGGTVTFSESWQAESGAGTYRVVAKVTERSSTPKTQTQFVSGN